MLETRSSAPAQPRHWPGRTGLLVTGLLALRVGVRGLRFTAPSFPWDEPVLAVPALQILEGNFPASTNLRHLRLSPTGPLREP